MIISIKAIFRTVVLISLTIVTLVYGVTYSLDIEEANIYSKEINTLIIPENNHQICDSLTGICNPPPGWYLQITNTNTNTKKSLNLEHIAQFLD